MRSIFWVLPALLLSGCGSHFTAWKGRSISDITQRWGKPQQVVPITDSKTAYAYRPADGCTVRITALRGVIQTVEPTGPECNTDAVKAQTPAPVDAR